jgi:hypothetical protein
MTLTGTTARIALVLSAGLAMAAGTAGTASADSKDSSPRAVHEAGTAGNPLGDPWGCCIPPAGPPWGP